MSYRKVFSRNFKTARKGLSCSLSHGVPNGRCSITKTAPGEVSRCMAGIKVDSVHVRYISQLRVVWLVTKAFPVNADKSLAPPMREEMSL